MNEVMKPLEVGRKELKGFFDKHACIAPVLINQENRKQSVLVHINPITLTAELYYKPNLSFDNSKYI